MDETLRRQATLKIIVCVKAVPGYILNPQLAGEGNKIDYTAGSIIINESDEYALEKALALKKGCGEGEVTVMTAGRLSSQKALHIGLAKDADRAARIDTDIIDSASIAAMLAEAVKRFDYDLILTGVESSDNMTAQTGVLMAGRLELPFAYAVTEVERGDKAGTLKVTKESGGGVRQKVEITLPALLCIQTGTKLPSYVPLPKMLRARSKPIKSFTAKDLNIEEELKRSASPQIVEIFSPQRVSKAEMIEGNPSEVASMVMKKIKEAL